MKRVGCLGGTFDPIHNGHLELAKLVCRTWNLDEIWFLPTKDTPLKNRSISAFSIRKKMIELAIKPYRKFKCCSIENELPAPSYTIQTVEKLKRRYPDIQFHWIVGDDQVAQFEKWKDIDKLLGLVQFICVPRNQIAIQDDRLWVSPPFHHGASSTAIRKGNFSYLPKSVRNYVLKNELYLTDIVSEHCSEKRYKHVVSMSNLCVDLAIKHKVSPHEARMAGMLHDICKEMNREQMQQMMKSYYPEHLNGAPALFHAYVAVPWIKQNLGIYNHRILNAIANHVKGLGKSKLAKIVFIADKFDPGRGYECSEQIACAMNDLDKGVQLARKQQEDYRNKEEKRG